MGNILVELANPGLVLAAGKLGKKCQHRLVHFLPEGVQRLRSIELSQGL